MYVCMYIYYIYNRVFKRKQLFLFKVQNSLFLDLIRFKTGCSTVVQRSNPDKWPWVSDGERHTEIALCCVVIWWLILTDLYQPRGLLFSFHPTALSDKVTGWLLTGHGGFVFINNTEAASSHRGCFCISHQQWQRALDNQQAHNTAGHAAVCFCPNCFNFKKESCRSTLYNISLTDSGSLPHRWKWKCTMDFYKTELVVMGTVRAVFMLWAVSLHRGIIKSLITRPE